jgi:DNA-binding NarL/FixJ family response regulator
MLKILKMKNEINIFIVDDNNVFTLALKADIANAFKTIPLKINIFETGEKCMEKFKEEKPDVVILDYYLNKKFQDAANGIKVLEWIKKENPDTHVIMLTSDDDIDVALKSFHSGAIDYVVKTETQFRKINYSLINVFKIMEAKRYEKRYKNLLVGVYVFIALIVGAVLAIRISEHSL